MRSTRFGALVAPGGGRRKPGEHRQHPRDRVFVPYRASKVTGQLEQVSKYMRPKEILVFGTIAMSLLFSGAVLAGSNLYYKAALHVVPHEQRTCASNWPEIADCSGINTAFQGCADFDVFPVFFDLTEVARLEYGLAWPAAWGECVFTACAGDNTTGGIVSSGDGITHEWDQCHRAEIVIPGYAWFASPVTPGQIVLAANPVTGFLGATDCAGTRDFAIGLAASGVCGMPGEDPCSCGCGSERHTWGGIKTLFR